MSRDTARTGGTKGVEPGDWVEVVAPGDDFHGAPGRVEAVVDDGDGFDVVVKVYDPQTWGFRRDKLRKIPPPVPSAQQLELAYDAGETTLASQDTTLGNVRTRANNLLSTAALFISFSAGVGLINTDHTKGPVLSPIKALALLAVVAALGVCVLFALWPVHYWIFSPSAKKLLNQSNTETREELQAFVVEAMITGIDDNDDALKGKQRAFRYAAMLLLVEILLLVGFMTVWK